jgi:uncharacterized protein YkwD
MELDLALATNRRQRTARTTRTILCALVVLVLAPATGHAAGLGCGDNSAGTEDRSSFNADILSATNAHRTGMGLTALTLDPVLSKAALWKARDMGLRNYFSHDDPIPGGGTRTPWQRLIDCGYDVPSSSRAENIAAGHQSGAAFAAAWIASPGHRANIETAAMRYIGIATAYVAGSTYGTYSVQIFSSKPSQGATTSTTPAAAPPAPPSTTQLTLIADGTSTDICPSATSPRGTTFAFEQPSATDIDITRTSAGCLRFSARTTSEPTRTDVVYHASSPAGDSAAVTLHVDVESRRSLAGLDPTHTSAAKRTTLRGSSARISSARCASRSKRCWYATITIRLRSTRNAPVGGQRIAITRRDRTGRAHTLGARATNDRGVAVVRILLHPPARGTATWLVRNWKKIGMRYAGTHTYAPSSATALVRR